ncbi:hypothetical protein APHDU1_1508 [Anaplasma phagocytophilum]|uniref:Uncharacterized protein n=2 Tax=Anaplasma phagocytophilum TaxID=948 RepID=Q2GK18_ANAPZ|nr:hypothetical protein APH_0702 [Anaplasma phagocytophilum str. HZ]KJV63272.1 hypothetical protein EPHNCH_1009 [Anaplasma phagocytophilum str. NCH-1]KJV83495.1 hypothetical protein APHHGE2_0996 [Anaplasma phagocytophilum str. HGE2]KJV87368.1 hypothetical protein APHNYW_0707 [Anaplasma phagocytophilum str. ApNYW]KJV98619.1 hypothetical protein OTSANNIE_0969 [Anaplasma phagocytophilum str. Annie]KJZ97963.1 hypothetical protein APHDU1_1508 [Anaplasma phagocytophilum]
MLDSIEIIQLSGTEEEKLQIGPKFHLIPGLRRSMVYAIRR